MADSTADMSDVTSDSVSVVSGEVENYLEDEGESADEEESDNIDEGGEHPVGILDDAEADTSNAAVEEPRAEGTKKRKHAVSVFVKKRAIEEYLAMQPQSKTKICAKYVQCFHP